MRKIITLGVIALGSLASAAVSTAPPASGWEIGPVIRGRNYSVGMPLQPAPAGRGWAFDFPVGCDSGHVHYVTYNPGSLTGARRLVVRYRVEARPGTRFIPEGMPQLPATVSFVIQRRGDNWSARGDYEYYRWYAPMHSVREIGRGEHEVTIRLDDPMWGSVMGMSAADHPEKFEDALANAARIGLVFGSRSGRGHGVCATDPARFTLLRFSID